MVNDKKLAIIARMDHSGLGHQTRDLVRLLDPYLVVLVDFTFYNKFKQHPEWYEGRNTTRINGFIKDHEVERIAQQVDYILTAETFYNNRFIELAHKHNAITLSQINYEFFEPLMNRNLLIPDRILMPSYWHLEDMQKMTSPHRTIYLPPPTFVEDFHEIKEMNINRTGKRRFLHIAGKVAAHDRAGTLDLLSALQFCKSDFELVIKVQSGDVPRTADPRVVIDTSNPEDEKDLYRDFDAMIHPRRYAGLNLPMNEALASGLPVIMTNISPNNCILPTHWLVPATVKNSFFARTKIDVYSSSPMHLAMKIDELASITDIKMKEEKIKAYLLAQKEYSPAVTKMRWDKMCETL